LNTCWNNKKVKGKQCFNIKKNKFKYKWELQRPISSCALKETGIESMSDRLPRTYSQITDPTLFRIVILSIITTFINSEIIEVDSLITLPIS
jgi:hypothetical protein